MIPSIGRIVHYTLTATDAEQVNRRRAETRIDGAGAVVHVGNVAREGDVLPLVIVRPWDAYENGAVNGQVLLDGNDSLWVTSRPGSDDATPGRWHAPPRV